MDKVKICLKTQQHETTILDIVEMKEKDGLLTIILNGRYNNLSISDIVSFSRNILNEDGNYQEVSSYSTRILTLNIVEDNTIITIVPPENYRIQVSNITAVNDFYRVDCVNDHNIFPQDLMVLSSDRKLYFQDTLRGVFEDICSIDDIRLYEYSSYFPNNIIESKYGLFNIKFENSYNCKNEASVFILSPNFYYKRNEINKNSFFVTNVLVDDINALYKGIYLPYNLFYYKIGDFCYIWDNYQGYDSVASTIHTIGDYQVVYNSSEQKGISSEVKFYEDSSEYKISFGLSQNVDYKHLYQEENITELFTEKVKEAVVENAPVIDMEKVKFSPRVGVGSMIETVSAITFNLHFRTRTDLQESWRYNDSATAYWNNDYCVGDYTGIINYSDIENHVKPKGNDNWVNNSDMLYYLGFTDEDVKNQKAKIQKSFLRLSFYDSTNPLTQKLLYYSTIFMDSGELFGKYVKAKLELKKNGKNTNNVVLDSHQTNYRLDCKFVIKDEFNTEKSSEGFNIYYFPDEIKELAKENTGKTIYMKVEFNHAGFGRTIPMFPCRSENNMSITKYKDRLYIKLELRYIDGKYVYFITDSDSGIIKQDATIEFNLFEPVIDKK